MTAFRQWFFGQPYSSVRYGELAQPLPDGGHLRGIRLTKFIWVGRDMQLYRLTPEDRRPVPLQPEVLDTIPSAVVRAQWQRATVRHERRKAVAKARRRRRVSSSALTSP